MQCRKTHGTDGRYAMPEKSGENGQPNSKSGKKGGKMKLQRNGRAAAVLLATLFLFPGTEARVFGAEGIYGAAGDCRTAEICSAAADSGVGKATPVSVEEQKGPGAAPEGRKTAGEIRQEALTDGQISWAEIPELVRAGNPVWLAVSGPAARESAEILSACEAFREELYENVGMIDEELEKIRERKAELRELPGTAVIDEQGTTAAEQLRIEEANERILKQNRRQTVLSVSDVIIPEKDRLRAGEERMELQYRSILESVEEMAIAWQQLKAEHDSFTARLEFLRAQETGTEAAFSRGLVSEVRKTETELLCSRMERETESLQSSMDGLHRSLMISLGFPADTKALIGAVPPADEEYVRSIDLQADLQRVLENSEELENTEGYRNFGKFGDEKLQKDEANRIRTELSSGCENAYRDILEEKTALRSARTALEKAETEQKLTEDRFSRGMISRLDLMKIRADVREARALVAVTELGYRSAVENYRKQTAVKTAGSDGPF